MKKEDFIFGLAVTFLTIALCVLLVDLGIDIGYKKGQLDYAQNNIEYAIDEEGKIIHYLNK